MVLVTAPDATHVVPFHATDRPPVENMVPAVTPTHVAPSFEYAMLFAPPTPTITHVVPFHAIPRIVENVASPVFVQVIPS